MQRPAQPRTGGAASAATAAAAGLSPRRAGIEDDEVMERALTPAEAAEWLHQHLGGRMRKPAAIRKLMRTGVGGVVLRSFRYGRELRTTEVDLKRFVREIRTATGRPSSRVATLSRAEHPPRSGLSDPADEIAKSKLSFLADRRTQQESFDESAEQIQLFSLTPPLTRYSSP